MIGSGQTTAFHILDRGYCGHEHLLEHGIINMNGRIYDPIVGQFMQADNYIQTPEDYIGYNRYAYCRYNPFKYTDPSGEQYQAGSGGGGAMAAMGAYYLGMEEQAQNAMAMALGDAMRNWNPRARIGEADAARARAQRSFGGASGGSASDGGFFGKAIKVVGSFFSNIFKKNAPASATGTSTSQQQGTGAGGVGQVQGCALPPIRDNKEFTSEEQPAGNTCGFQALASILQFFGFKVSAEDVQSKYEKKYPDIDWIKEGGARPNELSILGEEYGLSVIEIDVLKDGVFRTVLDLPSQPLILVSTDATGQNYNTGKHFGVLYDYQMNQGSTNFMSFDSRLGQYSMVYGVSKLNKLYDYTRGKTVYGLGFFKK